MIREFINQEAGSREVWICLCGNTMQNIPQYRHRPHRVMGWTVHPTIWTDSNGRVASSADAWGSSEQNYEGQSVNGRRMTCSREFLKTLLSAKKMDLLILIVLRKYEKNFGGEPSEYSHSTAVAHVDQDLKIAFYPGLANVVHKPNF